MNNIFKPTLLILIFLMSVQVLANSLPSQQNNIASIEISNFNLSDMHDFCLVSPSSCQAYLTGFIDATFQTSHLYNAKDPNMLKSTDTKIFPCFGNINHNIHGNILIINRMVMKNGIENVYTNYIKFMDGQLNTRSYKDIISSHPIDFTLDFLVNDYACSLTKDQLSQMF